MEMDLNQGRIEDSGAPPFVVFAIPSATYKVNFDFLMSFINTRDLLAQAGVASAIELLGGELYLDRARNHLASNFLRKYPDATDFFFLDDDIGWQPEAVLNFIALQEEFVAGVYPKKSDNPEFPASFDFTGQTLTFRNGLVRALSVPTGFMRLKRSALMRMVPHVEQYDYAVDAAGNTMRDFRFFKVGVEADGVWYGEDTYFCKAWRELGGEIWVDPDLTFAHSSRKKWVNSVAGSLVNFVQTYMAQQTMTLEAEGAVQPANDQTPTEGVA